MTIRPHQNSSCKYINKPSDLALDCMIHGAWNPAIVADPRRHAIVESCFISAFRRHLGSALWSGLPCNFTQRGRAYRHLQSAKRYYSIDCRGDSAWWFRPIPVSPPPRLLRVSQTTGRRILRSDRGNRVVGNGFGRRAAAFKSGASLSLPRAVLMMVDPRLLAPRLLAVWN
jgi:hypothetical protein